MLALLIIAGCSGSARGRAAEDTAPTVTIEELPAGIGRGFPIAAVAGGNQDTGIGIGHRAPNFRLTLEDGRTMTLHDLAGRPVMINFWATWCGPCRLEMPEIVRAGETVPNLVVLAVNVNEDLAPIQAFAEDFQMSMPVVRDEMGEVQDLYQIRGMPTTYFVDRKGIVRAVWAGILTPDRMNELLDEIL